MWGQAQTDSDLDSRSSGGGGLVRGDGDEGAGRPKEICEGEQETCEVGR
jgi:hypothetical protein